MATNSNTSHDSICCPDNLHMVIVRYNCRCQAAVLCSGDDRGVYNSTCQLARLEADDSPAWVIGLCHACSVLIIPSAVRTFRAHQTLALPCKKIIRRVQQALDCYPQHNPFACYTTVQHFIPAGVASAAGLNLNASKGSALCNDGRGLVFGLGPF